MHADECRYLTVRETAHRLQVHERTVYVWLRSSVLPGRRVGGRWRVSAKALEEFVRGDFRPSSEYGRAGSVS
ncbi:MAG: helix-turn-helix domain-containing protein [Bryobacterales bacterium]|nr:helix-turn-helix domain-containing protein [Bryobacterales bacterium]